MLFNKKVLILRFLCMTVSTAFLLMLTGCIAGSIIPSVVKGEPKKAANFSLSVSDNNYEIKREWNDENSYQSETLRISRDALPAGCKTARFFLTDSAHELLIGHPQDANWLTQDGLPLPDDGYPPCALLVSYGFFPGPPALEGVVVTHAAGLVKTSNRKQPHPTAWALLPAAAVAEIYVYCAAALASPVLLPVGIGWVKYDEKAKAKAKAALPRPVAACWTAIDVEMKKGGSPDQPFSYFEWDPAGENAYDLKTVTEVFSDDNPVAVDTRVTLRQGRAAFGASVWTDADIECGLMSGEVLTTRVNLHK
jgi:hypothetical protein